MIFVLVRDYFWISAMNVSLPVMTQSHALLQPGMTILR